MSNPDHSETVVFGVNLDKEGQRLIDIQNDIAETLDKQGIKAVDVTRASWFLADAALDQCVEAPNFTEERRKEVLAVCAAMIKALVGQYGIRVLGQLSVSMASFVTVQWAKQGVAKN